MKRLSRDAWVVITLFVILFIAAFFVGGSQRADESAVEPVPRRTSYSSRPSGLLAFHDTLHRLGYKVERQIESFDRLDPADGVLIIAAPELPISNKEFAAIKKWVERGNTLLMTEHDYPEFHDYKEKRKTLRSKPVYPSFLSDGVKSFEALDGGRIIDETWSFSETKSRSYG